MTKKIAWRETLAALGVIISLSFVAYEVRQNTKAVQSQTLQSISEQATELSFIGVDNPELRSALGKGWDGDINDLTPADRSILGWYYAGVMRVTENRYRQYQLGILSEESLRQFGGHAMVFRNEFFKDWWPGVRYQFPSDFVEYVDTILLPLRLPEG